MDELVSKYKTNVPKLKSLAPKWEDELLMALQHFQGYDGAMKYLTILKNTGSIKEADRQLSSPGNMSVSDYLFTFAN
jgi:hypothetical protein